MNHPMQGTAADIIKLAMRQVQDELVARDLGARLMLQVHDELDLSVPESEVEEVSDLLTSVMESVVELSVPLLVDVSAGANWLRPIRGIAILPPCTRTPVDSIRIPAQVREGLGSVGWCARALSVFRQGL